MMITRFSHDIKWKDVEHIYELFNELEKALREVWPYGLLEGAAHKISLARKETGDAFLFMEIKDCPLSEASLEMLRRKQIDELFKNAEAEEGK